MTPDLRAALTEVDRVFGGLTCRPDSVCLHCYALADVAPLAVAGADIDADTVQSLMHRSPRSVDDHPALVRRLLPQMARGMADGSIAVLWPAHHCLARGDWLDWPDEQSRAVRRFVETWWVDQATTPGLRSGAPFEAYAAMIGDLPTALASWPDHPVADAYLVTASELWVEDLLADENPLWLSDTGDDAETSGVLRNWYTEKGAERLARTGAAELARSARMLALPPEQRTRGPDGAPPTT